MNNFHRSRLLAGLLLAVATLAAGSARAEHGHAHIHYGFYVGAPWGWPYYPHPYYPPLYYPAPQIIVQAPPVYIEQGATQPAPAASTAAPSAYWYYCSNPQGYYPYVKQCTTAWQPVAPQPPTNNR